MKPISVLAIGLIACALGWLAGCDKIPTSLEDAKKAVSGGAEQATQAVENVTETVKQTTGAAGGIELQLDAPVKTSGCYAALYTFSDGRASILQVTSYNDPSAESFPSMIFRAETTAKSPGELAGQKLSAKAFVQENQNGNIWKADDKPLELTVSTADDATLGAAVTGTLVNVVSGATKDTSGTLNGSFLSK